MDAGALDAWRDLPAAQQPDWPDPAAVEAVTREIARIPPLAFAGECDSLKERPAAAARGQALGLPGGYADLRQVHTWNTDFVAASPAGQRYEALAREIDRALTFMHASGTNPAEFRTVEFYSSHEALLLEYERAMTRIDSRTGTPYDT